MLLRNDNVYVFNANPSANPITVMYDQPSSWDTGTQPWTVGTTNTPTKYGMASAFQAVVSDKAGTAVSDQHRRHHGVAPRDRRDPLRRRPVRPRHQRGHRLGRADTRAAAPGGTFTPTPTPTPSPAPSPSVAPSPTPTAAPTDPPSVVVTGLATMTTPKKASVRRPVAVSVTCPAACSRHREAHGVEEGGQEAAPKNHRLGSGRLTLPGSGTGAAKVKLSKAVRSAITRAGKVATKVVVVVTVAGTVNTLAGRTKLVK